jgi:hypothetical protein
MKLGTKSETLCAKLDNENLLIDTERTVRSVYNLFHLFIDEKISEAINQASKDLPTNC